MNNDELKKEIISVFLRNIGATSLKEIEDIATKSLSGKYWIKDLKNAANFILGFKSDKVRICGDYDVDGVTSTLILLESLERAGFKKVDYRVPYRFSEGFGLNRTMVEEAVKDGVKLLITCDNGVAQSSVIDFAKKSGLNVVVTDHHEPAVINGESCLPTADFVIDPNAVPNSAAYKGYCGAGVAYKLALQLLDKPYDAKLMALAAIATVADVMELREENYFFVKHGLSVLNDNCSIGMKALLTRLSLTEHVSLKDIGFKLGPCINACSRMDDKGASFAIECLRENSSWDRALANAEWIVQNNEERKTVSKDALNTALKVVESEKLAERFPLIVVVPDCGDGIIGLVASKLKELYNLPTIVLTQTEGGLLKGSCRSAGNYNFKDALDACSKHLIKYGGHKGAAGLTMSPDSLNEFRDSMERTKEGYIPDQINPLDFDIRIKSSQVSFSLELLERLAPFGEGNPPIKFAIEDASVAEKYSSLYRVMGQDGEHIRVNCDYNLSAIGFSMSKRVIDMDLKKDDTLCLFGTLSYNYYNGSKDPQIELTELVKTKVA